MELTAITWNPLCALAAGPLSYWSWSYLSSLSPAPSYSGDRTAEHLIAYGLVATLLAAICRTGRHFMTVCVSLPLCAAALEILQNFVPGRDPKFSDFAAGTAGAWIGIALVVVLRNLTAVDTTRSSEQLGIDTQRLLKQTPDGIHDD